MVSLLLLFGQRRQLSRPPEVARFFLHLAFPAMVGTPLLGAVKAADDKAFLDRAPNADSHSISQVRAAAYLGLHLGLLFDLRLVRSDKRPFPRTKLLHHAIRHAAKLTSLNDVPHVE